MVYNSWVVGLVTAQLKAGKPAGEVKVPAGDPTCKTNLFRSRGSERSRRVRFGTGPGSLEKVAVLGSRF